jgi:hypothetical protein
VDIVAARGCHAVPAQSQSGGINDPQLFSPQTSADQHLQENTVTGQASQSFTPPTLLQLTPFLSLPSFGNAAGAIALGFYNPFMYLQSCARLEIFFLRVIYPQR